MEDNSLIINFELLEQLNISISEFLFLSYNYFDKEIDIPYNNVDLNKLEKQQYIKKIIEKNEKIIIIRNKSIELIEKLYVNTNVTIDTKKTKVYHSKRHINEQVEERIAEYRTKWKGLKPGSMGSAKACKQKLTRWMKENPEYSFDDILKAVDIYLNSEGLNVKFLQRADYFIFKQESNKEESSRLSAFIDEVQDYVADDWTTNLN